MKLFKDIRERIANKVSTLQYVEEDDGQLDFWDTPPVQWPCALIDCDEVIVSQSGKKQMVDNVEVVIRIADYGGTTGYPEENRDAFGGIIEDVVKTLHGWCGSPGAYSRLQRTGQKRVKRKDGIRLMEVYFSCIQYNTTAQKEYLKVSDYIPVIKPGDSI